MTPGEELQRLIYSTLKADTAVMALIDGVYDDVPDNPFGVRKAYVSFGPSDMVPEDPDCIEGETHSFQLDVWSREVGFVACKKICAAVKRCLHLADLTLTDNALVEIRLELQRVFRDPDGLTSHGAMQFVASVEVP